MWRSGNIDTVCDVHVFTVAGQRRTSRITQAALLDRIRSCCRSVLANASMDEQAAEQCCSAAAKLAASIKELRGLLLQHIPEPPEITGGGVAPDSSPDSTTAVPRAALLHLPDELLTPLIRLAGKKVRAVCHRLRDAYGCPGLAIKHPPSQPSMEANNPWTPRYSESVEEFCRRALWQLTRQHSTQAMFNADRRVGWHGWAAGVTRLELSDACPLDVDALACIPSALPGLRQLACSGGYHLRAPQGDQLPQLTALTTLCLISGREEVLLGYHQLTFGLLAATPNVQRLHLDLQRVRLKEGVPRNALRGLTQLTHLELACNPAAAHKHGVQDTYGQQVWCALEALGERLRSLVLLTPVGDMAPGQLLAALRAMTALTSLGFCTGWLGADGKAKPLEMAAECLKLGSLRELVLGSADLAESGDLEMEETEGLRRAVASVGLRAGVALQALVLPVLCMKDVPQEDLPRVRALLEAVVGVCPCLTSLRVGVDSSSLALLQIGAAVEDEQGMLAWLPPVGRLAGLQQLALSMMVCEVDMLACLAELPVLRELWVDFVDREAYGTSVARVYKAHYPEQAARPLGSVVALLTSLEVLAVSTEVGHELLLPGLLEAAAGLPRLQALRARVDLDQLDDSEAPWRPLATRPPPCLKEVEVTTNCCNSDGEGGWPAKHEGVVGFLRERLPAGVAVVLTPPYAVWEPAWAPRPCRLVEMSLRWDRHQRRVPLRQGASSMAGGPSS